RRLGVRTLPPVLAEQDRAADDRSPQSVHPAEQRDERLAQLLGRERAVLEERELPPVERLAEIGILVGGSEPRQQVGGDRTPERVEPRRLARRLRRRD